MRPGLSWQASVLKLLARGQLPTDHALARQALTEMLTPDLAEPGDDALDHAERLAAQTAGSRTGRLFLRAFERNLRRSPSLLEPGTEVSSVATGTLATLHMMVTGEATWSPEALTEMKVAAGFPVADMTGEDRRALARFTAIFVTEVSAPALLAAVAAQAPLNRIMQAVPAARETLAELLRGPGPGIPPNEDLRDVLTVWMTLVLIRIENLGGDEALVGLVRRAKGARPQIS
jgi:hypothetical protein